MQQNPRDMSQYSAVEEVSRLTTRQRRDSLSHVSVSAHPTEDFELLDSLQLLHAELSRTRGELGKEKSERVRVERILKDSAAQILDFKSNFTQQQVLMADRMLSTLSRAQRSVKAALLGIVGGGPNGSLIAGKNQQDDRKSAASKLFPNSYLPFDLKEASPQHCANYTIMAQLLDSTGGAEERGGVPAQLNAVEESEAVGAAKRPPSGTSSAEEEEIQYKRSYASVLHTVCLLQWEHLLDLLLNRVREYDTTFNALQTEIDALKKALSEKDHELASLRGELQKEITEGRLKREALQQQFDDLRSDWLSVAEALQVDAAAHVDDGGNSVASTPTPSKYAQESRQLAMLNTSAFVAGGEDSYTNVASRLPTKADLISAIEERRDVVFTLDSLVLKMKAELAMCKEEFACELLRTREIFQSAFCASASEVRFAAAEFHRGLVNTSCEFFSKFSFDLAQRCAVESNLVSACDGTQKELGMLKAVAKRQRQVMLANHAVELTAVSQRAAAQQRRLEEMSEKLSKSLAREGQLKREVKAKEAELEVMSQLSEQRSRDFHRKSAALEELKGKYSIKQSLLSTANESLRAEKEHVSDLKEQQTLLTKQLDSSIQEVARLRDKIDRIVSSHKAEMGALVEEHDAKMVVTRNAHRMEVSVLQSEVERLKTSLISCEFSLASVKEEKAKALEEKQQTEAIVKTQASELEDMRGELKRAKAMLEEGLRRWSMRGMDTGVAAAAAAAAATSAVGSDFDADFADATTTGPQKSLQFDSPPQRNSRNGSHNIIYYSGRDNTPSAESAVGSTPRPSMGRAPPHHDHGDDRRRYQQEPQQQQQQRPAHHIDSVAASTAAALRISELEAENEQLRAACEMSVNQSVELMEAFHRKRRGGGSSVGGGSLDGSIVSSINAYGHHR